jgi:hypothetical protein
MPAAEEPQNGAHHSEAPDQGKPQSGLGNSGKAAGHGSCIAMRPVRASPRNRLKDKQYFILFKE